MNLRQMEVFRAIMLTGTIAGASEVLHVSQPAISKTLSLAERQSGLQLFDRVKGRLIPTPGAKALYEEIDRLWVGVERVRKLSFELSNPADGTLHVAASSSLGAAVVPAAMSELLKQFPKLRAKVDLLVPRMLIDTLVDHSVDIGVAMFELDHPNLTTVARYSCGWVCVLPRGHPLGALEQIGPEDLAGYRLISFPQEAGYGVEGRSLFGDYLDRLDFALEVRAGQSACLFALAGAGVAIVDEVTVRGGVFPQLEVRPFKTKARLEVCVIRNAFKPLTPIGNAFCDCIANQWTNL